MTYKSKFSVIFFISITIFLGTFGTGLAVGEFHKGTVTRGPWFNVHPRIEIDSINYLLMPDVKITLVQAKKKKYDYKGKKQDNTALLVAGMHIWFKTLGHNIYEILVDAQEGNHE
jgi:hypothetical protein